MLAAQNETQLKDGQFRVWGEGGHVQVCAKGFRVDKVLWVGLRFRV